MKKSIFRLFAVCLTACFVSFFPATRLSAEAPVVTSDTKVLAHFNDSTTIELDYGNCHTR